MADVMWHYMQGGQQYEPISEQQLHEMITAGQLASTDFVWCEGMAEWDRIQNVPGLAELLPPPAAPVVPVLNYKRPSTPKNYAGFWRRFLACFIDCVLLGGSFYGLVYLASDWLLGLNTRADIGGIIHLVWMAVNWLYYSAMESSRKRATIGKMALGIWVTDMKGNQLTFARATGRYFARIPSYFFLIGFVMVAFTRRKQGLHDLIADTLVVSRDRSAKPAAAVAEAVSA